MIEPQLLLSDSPCEQIMKVTQRMSSLAMLAFAVVAVGVLAFVSGAPLASLTPALAQEATNATTTDTTTTTANATSPETEATPEGGGTETTPTMTEEREHTSNETATERTTTEGTTTIRDSVFALLADHTIPASGFIHLYDTTPYSIKNGHVAAKIPCDDESAPLLNVLIGVAPQFTPAPLELVANLSTPGELCLYHVDLPAREPEQQANTTTTTAANTTTAAMITDIAIQNPGDEDITLPSTSTVVIGINEIEKGAHTHEEGEAGEQPQAGAP